MTFKCKMCGGTLEFEPGATVGVCEYCGTRQTLPRLDDDKKMNLYDRANHFRRNNDYDKAIGIFEQILNEDKTDAEAYWSLVLCRYGIEYVEDPMSHKRIPTVNRTQLSSIFVDEDYKSALQYADTYQRGIYEEEARAIDEIQKNILLISQKEEPFDIFICYKETDENGRRTPDSVYANELYHQLTQEGYRVFYARITLEDKLGSAYEPYIFAALNSSKVMVVIGTKPDFFNAVWVRNEWSRFLSLIKQGDKKTLIPAYRDMDPYNLPSAFSNLQALDMSKLGFMQDLIRGINKILDYDKIQTKNFAEYVPVIHGNNNEQSLLKRGFMSLEDKEWDKADDFFDQVLNLNAECGDAYLGLYLAQKQCRNLKDYSEIILKDIKSESVTACPENDEEISNICNNENVKKYLEIDFVQKSLEFDRTYLSTTHSLKEQLSKIRDESKNSTVLKRAEQFGSGTEIIKIQDDLVEELRNRIEKAEKDDEKNESLVRLKYKEHLENEKEKLILEANSKKSDSEKRKEQEDKKSKLVLIAGAAIAIIVITVLIIIGQKKDNEVEQTPSYTFTDSTMSSTSDTNNDGSSETSQVVENYETHDYESSETEEYSAEDEIRYLIPCYLDSYICDLNTKCYDVLSLYVEPFSNLQQALVKQVESSDLEEQLLGYEIVSIDKIDVSTYHVTVIEEYDVYNTVSEAEYYVKQKCKYEVRLQENGEWMLSDFVGKIEQLEKEVY